MSDQDPRVTVYVHLRDAAIQAEKVEKHVTVSIGDDSPRIALMALKDEGLDALDELIEAAQDARTLLFDMLYGGDA